MLNCIRVLLYISTCAPMPRMERTADGAGSGRDCSKLYKVAFDSRDERLRNVM